VYKPSAFLISAAALTSIFSFFFGGYYKDRSPFFLIRPRVTGMDRLSKVWMVLGCSKLKTPEYAQNRIPQEFYDNQDYYSKESEMI